MFRPVSRSRARRRGVSMWLFAATLPITLGACGLVIDIGQLYARRAQAQRAADAAALAGAIVSGGDNSAVETTAQQYARVNGYDVRNSKTQVRVTPNYSADGGTTSNTVRVWVAHEEPVYFAPIAEAMLDALGWSRGAAVFERRVSASAVAQKKVRLKMNLGGTYGIGNPDNAPTSNSVYGPMSQYRHGDPYSVQFLQDGSPNPRYAQTQGYSDYTLNISSQFLSQTTDGKAYLQIFDPDCYNALGLYEYDELRAPNTNIPGGGGSEYITQTQYEIYKIDGPNSQRFIASSVYGADASTDKQWVTPNGFNIDLNAFGTGEYRIRVKALNGSSENAFQLRAGPLEGTTMDETTWNQTYGDKNGTDPNAIAAPITSEGRLMMNFGRNGMTRINLGYVGAEYAGKSVDVSKFDVDVGSQSIAYKLDSLPDFVAPGTIPQPADGIWSTDNIQIPAGFAGGNIYAEYVAGYHDTSNWELSGEGTGEGTVRLIE